MFYAHAQVSVHAQYALLFYAHSIKKLRNLKQTATEYLDVLTQLTLILPRRK